MAEQLLDRAQVGAAVEQVRGERVAQRVRARRRPGPRRARAQTRSRRRTSDVDRRRPDFERNSAGSPSPARERRAAALEVARERRAAPARRPGTMRVLRALALDAHLLGVEVDRADVEVDELLGAQAAGVGELEQRAVAQLQRRRRRDAVQQRGDLARARGRAAAAGRAWAPARSSAGFCATSPCSRSVAEEARAARRACARRSSARARRSDSARGVAAQRRAASTVGRLDALPRRPQRELPEVDAVGAARLLGRAAAAQVGVEAARSALDAMAGRGCGAMPRSARWECSSSTRPRVRSPRSASCIEAGIADRGDAAAAAVAAHPGHGRRVDACGTRCCASGSGGSSSARWSFATATTMPCCSSAAGRRSPVDEIARSRAAAARSRLVDVDRRADGTCVVELDRRPGSRMRMQPCEAAVPIEPSRVGAVDAGAVVDAHPARLERVLGPPPGMTLPASLPAQSEFGHVPGRVDRLVLDRVEAGGRLEAGLADGDAVGLRRA